MKSYILTEEEYNTFKQQRRNHIQNKELVNGDKIFISSFCKIDKEELINYITENYENVYLTPNIDDATIILVNDNAQLYTVNIGYEYENKMFIDETQWKVFISRLTPKYKPKEDVDDDILQKSYKDTKNQSVINYEDATKKYYINIYDDSHTVESIMDFLRNEIDIVSENFLINKIKNNIEYDFEIEDIIKLLISHNNANVNIAIKTIKKITKEELIKYILPYYYSEKTTRNAKNLLYNEIFSKDKEIGSIILQPQKAAWSHYRHVKENIKRIQRKTKIKINEKEFIKSYLDE